MVARNGVGIRRAIGTFRHGRGAEVHAQVLIVAHFLEIVGEHFGEGITVGYGIVFALFLPDLDGIAHLLCCFREDVMLIELDDRAVDYVRSRCRVNLEG